MKRVLITGANSYVGSSVKKWLSAYGKAYAVDTISLRDKNWKKSSFADYDAVFHVAGIAHVSADERLREQYFAINRDLTIETAKKAKADGVKQFIFMSSIIVYGNSSAAGKEKWITSRTKPEPADFYGQSKLEAEEGILALEKDGFQVAVVRAPMIYGPGSKGNYPRLSKLARKTPLFPSLQNHRSMLYIDNLCEFIRLLLEDGSGGIYYPQNKEYVSTGEMVRCIADCHGKKLYLVGWLNPLVRFAGCFLGLVNKVFGSMAYRKDMSSHWEYAYCVTDFAESIKQTEGKRNGAGKTHGGADR
ncbi:MAG: NAD-dependent epimerase/dehydratase family protein [Lachnospiraceae bacterium]|nr:NAD-dependent epimerase/dehydratase family protein [Lachnospiraceae bacterium]